MAATNWKEPKLLAYCLLSYCKYVLCYCNVLEEVIIRPYTCTLSNTADELSGQA